MYEKYFFISILDVYYYTILWLNSLSINILLSLLILSSLLQYYKWSAILAVYYTHSITLLSPTITYTTLLSSLEFGLVNIHPTLLYFSLLTFLIFIFLRNSWGFQLSLFIQSLGLSLALILGMFWGVFSNLWGFFWVNDVIEWILFFWLYLLLILLHRLNLRYFLIYLYVLILLIGLFAIRLNFFTTRHSFFLTFFVNNLYSYLGLFTKQTLLYLWLLLLDNTILFKFGKLICIIFGIVSTYYYFYILKIDISWRVFHQSFLLFFIFWVFADHYYINWYNYPVFRVTFSILSEVIYSQKLLTVSYYFAYFSSLNLLSLNYFFSYTIVFITNTMKAVLTWNSIFYALIFWLFFWVSKQRFILS